jgi:hypothetical protein
LPLRGHRERRTRATMPLTRSGRVPTDDVGPPRPRCPPISSPRAVVGIEGTSLAPLRRPPRIAWYRTACAGSPMTTRPQKCHAPRAHRGGAREVAQGWGQRSCRDRCPPPAWLVPPGLTTPAALCCPSSRRLGMWVGQRAARA